MIADGTVAALSAGTAAPVLGNDLCVDDLLSFVDSIDNSCMPVATVALRIVDTERLGMRSGMVGGNRALYRWPDSSPYAWLATAEPFNPLSEY